MKKFLEIGLLVIWFVVLLSACSIEQTSSENNNSVTSTEFESTTSTGETEDASIDYNWYEGKRYRGTENDTLFWIQDGKVNTSLRYLCQLSDMEIETVESNAVGVGLKYFYYAELTDAYGEKRYDTIVLEYYPHVDRVILTEIDNLYKGQYNCSDVYEYDSMVSESSSNQTHSEDIANVCYLSDGQRFECFETISGEDITLTVHLYYSDNSSMPSSYKGELSNGMEFRFEPYEILSDCITYKVSCTDGTRAYLNYNCNVSEIVLTADEGNLCAYSGTYIELPDTT